MELDYRLTKNQERELAILNEFPGSWALRRYQGTGLKFWRIDLSAGTEWTGAQWIVEGRTLRETIGLAVSSLQQNQTRP